MSREFYWIYRDNFEQMWVGDINVNDPQVAARMPFRWKINDKRATRNEIRAEWQAIRNTDLCIKVNETYFKRYVVLYLPAKDYKNLIEYRYVNV